MDLTKIKDLIWFLLVCRGNEFHPRLDTDYSHIYKGRRLPDVMERMRADEDARVVRERKIAHDMDEYWSNIKTRIHCCWNYFWTVSVPKAILGRWR